MCEDFLGGSLDYLRLAHCSSDGGAANCDISDYNSSDLTQDYLSVIVTPTSPTSQNRSTYSALRDDNEEGFETALATPGVTYGFEYSLDADPTTLLILKEPGYDAL